LTRLIEKDIGKVSLGVGKSWNISLDANGSPQHLNIWQQLKIVKKNIQQMGLKFLLTLSDDVLLNKDVIDELFKAIL
jgi:hypothetical protein